MSKLSTAKRSVAPLASDPYAPSSQAPVRCTFRPHFANTEVQPHSHPWAQMLFSSQGVVRVHTGKTAFTLPPWRAVWIPSQTLHTAEVLEDAQIYSLYLLPDERNPNWQQVTSKWSSCRVIEVSALLRELVMGLAADDLDRLRSDRYISLVELTVLEIHKAPSLALGISLPSERRLRALCEDFLQSPRLDRPLTELAQNAGASVSTINRLFQAEIGCSFAEWRKQSLLAEALVLAAKGYSVSQIAFELGYSSLSAFSFMVTQLVGIPPSKLLKSAPA